MHGDQDHGERRAGWLSFGTEVVPLRDNPTQEAEGEQTERLNLIKTSRWHRLSSRLMLTIALAVAATLLLTILISRSGGSA